jgi:hypothetical protein
MIIIVLRLGISKDIVSMETHVGFCLLICILKEVIMF